MSVKNKYKNMTEEELEYNKQCALFIGGKTKKTALPTIAERLANNEWWLPYFGTAYNEQLKFHSDWNWIMLVVERIKTIEDNQSECLKSYYNINFKIDLLNGVELYVDKERLFLQTSFGEGQLMDAVVGGIKEFLIWYNDNKK